MIIEGMVAVGVGFTAICGVSATGQVDKIAEENGWQEKGELEKWQNKNVFNMWDLLDVNDFIEDVWLSLKEECGMTTTAEAKKSEEAAKDEATEEAKEEAPASSTI